MKVLIEFITETGKKKKIKYILGMGSSNTENYNNDFYSYLQKTWSIHTQSTILNQSDTEGAENLTCRESPSSYAA